MEPVAKFIGFTVPPGKGVTVDAEIDEDVVTTFHFTQIALGEKPGKGPHTVFIENEDGKFAVGTLNRDSCTQFSVDITIAGDVVVFSHTGPSDVHITGYLTQEPMGYEEDSEDDMMGYRGALGSDDDTDMDEEDEEDEEESDDDEAPMAVPLSGGKEAQAHVDDETDDDSSEEEDSDEDESSEEGEEESEEEEEAPAAANKRKAAPQTPQPAKKAKGETPKAPATAPAKVGAGDATPANDAEYAKAIKAYLQKNGPKRIAELGTAVKRPPKSPKMKKILEAHKDTFKYNELTQTVSLA